MNLNELIKRIVDTCTYNEMCVDTESAIEYVCMITPSLIKKDALCVTEDIIYPLMNQFSDTDDKQEQSFIQDTILMIMEYMQEG